MAKQTACANIYHAARIKFLPHDVSLVRHMLRQCVLGSACLSVTRQSSMKMVKNTNYHHTHSAGASKSQREPGGLAPTRNWPSWAEPWPGFFLMYRSLCAPPKTLFGHYLLDSAPVRHTQRCTTTFFLPAPLCSAPPDGGRKNVRFSTNNSPLCLEDGTRQAHCFCER